MRLLAGIRGIRKQAEPDQRVRNLLSPHIFSIILEICSSTAHPLLIHTRPIINRVSDTLRLRKEA